MFDRRHILLLAAFHAAAPRWCSGYYNCWCPSLAAAGCTIAIATAPAVNGHAAGPLWLHSESATQLSMVSARCMRFCCRRCCSSSYRHRKS